MNSIIISWYFAFLFQFCKGKFDEKIKNIPSSYNNNYKIILYTQLILMKGIWF